VTVTTAGTTQNAAVRYPDIVANLRVDQAWGSAQIMGAIHDASGMYYGANTNSGAPSYNTGWAAGVGVKFNTPMVGKGDYFSSQFNYSVGAQGYPNNNSNVSYGAYHDQGGGTYGFGYAVDGVYGVVGGANTGVELTTVWGINAGYEHFWTPHWQTSLYGAYLHYDFDSNANTILCASQAAVINAALTLANGCNNDFQYWDIGTRTQFNIDSQTYIGVDVIYTKLQTASAGVGGLIAIPGSGTQPAANRTIADQSAWMAEFRIHRNFYP